MVACAKTFGKEIPECTRGEAGCICKQDENMLLSCGWFQRGNGTWSHADDNYIHRSFPAAMQINSGILKLIDRRGQELENYMAKKYPNLI